MYRHCDTCKPLVKWGITLLPFFYLLIFTYWILTMDHKVCSTSCTDIISAFLFALNLPQFFNIQWLYRISAFVTTSIHDCNSQKCSWSNDTFIRLNLLIIVITFSLLYVSVIHWQIHLHVTHTHTHARTNTLQSTGTCFSSSNRPVSSAVYSCILYES